MMFYRIVSFLIIAVFLWTVNHAQAQNSDITLDHVIIAVSDIDQAANRYSDLGFTIKNGRLHKNGLLNKHVKFKDGSAVELMTIQGSAKDKISKAYELFLENQEGGIYVALKASFDILAKKADELNLSYHVSLGSPFSYMTFEDESLKNIFFINYSNRFSDPDSIKTHQNNVTGIKAVWLKSTPLLTELLVAMNASSYGMIKTPDNKENPVYRLNGYDFIIDESSREDAKILGIRFKTEKIPSSDWLPPALNYGVWLSFK